MRQNVADVAIAVQIPISKGMQEKKKRSMHVPSITIWIFKFKYMLYFRFYLFPETVSNTQSLNFNQTVPLLGIILSILCISDDLASFYFDESSGIVETIILICSRQKLGVELNPFHLPFWSTASFFTPPSTFSDILLVSKSTASFFYSNGFNHYASTTFLRASFIQSRNITSKLYIHIRIYPGLPRILLVYSFIIIMHLTTLRVLLRNPFHWWWTLIICLFPPL